MIQWENEEHLYPFGFPLFPGSRGRLQGGASWSMENYFQAEAFNLDKVLDEFEQNEGEKTGEGRGNAASVSGEKKNNVVEELPPITAD